VVEFPDTSVVVNVDVPSGLLTTDDDDPSLLTVVIMIFPEEVVDVVVADVTPFPEIE
jgi:hypothetical protein